MTDQDIRLRRAAVTPARRSDAGATRFTSRDIAGLLLAGELYGAPYDLLGDALDVRPDRLRAITSRWRRAGLAESGRLGPGPGWCWLTVAGMRAAGLRFPARRPPLGRLAHIGAVLAARVSLEQGDAYRHGEAWWRSERRICSAARRVGIGHVPDAEVHWPAVAGSAYPDECWAIEAELTAKPAARTAEIMTGLLARRTGWEPGSRPGPEPRYHRVVYLCSPAALPVAERAAARLPTVLAARVTVRNLPAGRCCDLVVSADQGHPLAPSLGRPAPEMGRDGCRADRRLPSHRGCRYRRGRGVAARLAGGPAAVPPRGRCR